MSQSQVDVLVRYVRQLQGDITTDAPTDRELLRRYGAQRDEPAFASLVQRHGPLVWAVCRRALGHQDAEDVFQAAFLVLAKKATAVRWQESVGPWLHAVATRLARKVRTEARATLPLVDIVPAPSRSLDTMSAQELLVALDEELSALPEKCRGPLVLCLLQGKTQDEAARLLGTSLSSVRRYLERGRQRLHARLTRRGLSLATACAAALAPSTISAAPVVVLAGGAKGSALSARALELAQTLLRPTPMKYKAVLALLLVLGAVAAGFGLAADGPSPAPPGPSPEEAQFVAARAFAPAPNPRVALEEPLPPGARARLGTTRFRHGAWVYSLAYSPDGKQLATGGGDRAIILWGADTGRALHRLVGHRRSCQKVAFSPDGKLLASVGWEEAVIVLWDVATGKEVRRFPGHPRYTHDVSFSPDGKFVASTGLDPGVMLWDVATGKIVRHLPEGQKSRCHVIFAPDGKTLVGACQDGSLRVWNTATGKELRRIPRIAAGAQSMAFSRDGNSLAVGTFNATGTASVYDFDSGKLLRAWPGHKGYLSTVRFSPDGKKLAVSSYRSYDFRTPPSIRLYDIGTGLEAPLEAACGGAIHGVAFSPDGKVLAAADTNSVRRWAVATGRELPPLGHHRGAVWSVAVSPDGKTIYSGSQDSTVRGWGLATGKEALNLAGHASLVPTVRLTPDGKVLGTADTSNLVLLWDADTGKALRRIEVRGPYIRTFAFAPDGRSLVTANTDRSLQFWDVGTGKELRRFPGSGLGYCLAFSPDGRMVGVGGEADFWQCVRILDPGTGRGLGSLRHLQTVMGVAFSPDGRWLATALDGGDNLVRLHEVPSCKEVRQFRGHTKGAQDVAFSPDGWALASASRDGTVRLWEVATGQERRRFEGHKGEVHGLAFSADGRFLVSGGEDTAILVWGLTDRAATLRRGKAPTPAQLEQRWAELAGPAAPRAYEAICYLTAFPEQTVPLLRERVLKMQPSGKRLAQLVRDLDDDDFEVREKATRELEGLGKLIEPDLRAARAKAKSLEVIRRLERLLQALARQPGPFAQSETVRLLRALEVLEKVGTPAARQALETVANSKPASDLTRAASAARKRLGR